MSYQKEICKKAVEQYGKQPQIIMAMEEMSELIQAYVLMALCYVIWYGFVMLFSIDKEKGKKKFFEE